MLKEQLNIECRASSGMSTRRLPSLCRPAKDQGAIEPSLRFVRSVTGGKMPGTADEASSVEKITQSGAVR